MKRLVCALVLLGAAAPAVAATSPFAGSWKFDAAKSKLTGDTFTLAKTTSGYRYSNGSTVSYGFAIDGKPHPTIADRTVAWTRTPDGWDLVTKAGGRVLSKAHRTLSADGKTLTSTIEEYTASGKTLKETDVYKRVSGTGGLAGKWQDVKVDAPADSLDIAVPAAGHYQISFPTEKETASGTTDGAPTALKGPTIPAGVTVSYKAVSPTKWSYKIVLNGKTFEEGELTASVDGKTLTDTSWVPGKKSEASISVYTKA